MLPQSLVIPALLVFLALATTGRHSATGAELYVASDGADTNPGTRERPFATLERARDAVRQMRRADGTLPEGVTVWLREGVYRLHHTFELTAQDSGSMETPVVYRSAPGERARLVGGLALPAAAFGPVTDAKILARMDPGARDAVLVANLAALGLTDFGPEWPVTFRGYAGWPELFFDGTPMTLARWPNQGFTRMARVVDRGSQPRYGEKPDRPGTFEYEGDRPLRWLQAKEVYLSGYWCYKWYSETIRVADINPETRTITLAAPHVYGIGGPSGGEYFALNLLEELDAPGEYYVDREARMLYLWPPTPMQGREVLLSLLEQPLVSLTDTSDVMLRDLTFEGSKGFAVTINGGERNLVAGCTIRNLAADAIKVSGGRDNAVVGCDLYNIGGAGILLSGGDRPSLTPCGNHATNNHIHHWGRLFRTHRDAISLNGVGCIARHNLMHHAPHHAMGFGGNEHLVEFNEVHHVCLETDDAGAIYTGRDWTVRGNVIRYNFWHHVGGGPHIGNQAIYLDDNACGTTCYGNVVFRVLRAFLIGGGRDNVVDNNLIVDCPVPVHIDNRGMSWSGPGTENWVTLTDRYNALPCREEPWASRYPTLANILEDEPELPKRNVVRNNIMVRCGEMSLAPEALELGTFEGNWATDVDPGFVNPEELDFRLRPDSPAYQQAPGHAPIPFEKIGLMVDEYRTSLPAQVPWASPEPGRYAGEVSVTLRCRTRGATIHYTLDGSLPTRSSPRYEAPIRLTETTKLVAVAAVPGERDDAVSSPLLAIYEVFPVNLEAGVYLSDLPVLEAFVHGALGRDRSYMGTPIQLGGKTYARGLMTHTEESPEGGFSSVTFALEGPLARASRFTAHVGVDDSAGQAGSCVFIVEVRRQGEWQRLWESPVLRGGEPGMQVDVDISGADRLRLLTTDAGDNIHSDHAVWADAKLQ